MEDKRTLDCLPVSRVSIFRVSMNGALRFKLVSTGCNGGGGWQLFVYV